MATIGCLGEIPFFTSSRAVQTVQDATWSGSARYSVHDRHLTNALTEFTGVDPDAFSFNIRLSAFLSVDPMAAINLLWQYERSGKAVPLVLGEKAYGKYRWNVISHKVTVEHTDREGNVLSALVSVKLQEYLRG